MDKVVHTNFFAIISMFYENSSYIYGPVYFTYFSIAQFVEKGISSKNAVNSIIFGMQYISEHVQQTSRSVI